MTADDLLQIGLYLALLAVLVGLTAAYIGLCAKLEDRK
jgi:hypothetical protein